MKYYAVTDDPNELLHYGVKGMKWGQHLFGDDLRPKSASYKRALGKLRGFASKAKSAVKKTATQHSIDRQRKQEERYNRAVQKAQQRVNVVEGLNNLSKMQSFERNIDKSNKAELKAERRAAKLQRRYDRNERKMQKYTQEAREGRLRYGKLSDEQIRRITDRLALERSARSLGNTEKPSYRLRRKEAIREGKLEGYKRGTTAAMEEVARAGTIYGIKNFMNRKKRDAYAKQLGKENRIRSREQNKRTHKEMREDLRREAYEEELRDNQFIRTHITARGAAKSLKKLDDKQHEAQRSRAIGDKIKNELDLGNNETYQKFLSEQREHKRIQDVQDRLNSETDEKWNRYLNETGLSDVEARAKSKLFDTDQVDKATHEQAQAQRAAILAKNEQVQNKNAYNQYIKQQRIQQAHDAEVAKLEKENKQTKEDYQEKLSKYEADIESDRKAKAKYDQEMAEYNRAVSDYNAQMNRYNEDYRVFVRTASYDSLAVEPKKPVLTAKKPSTPNYINPKKPAEPTYKHIDYTEPVLALPSYEQYMRQRNIGISSFGNKNNSGGKGKNKR